MFDFLRKQLYLTAILSFSFALIQYETDTTNPYESLGISSTTYWIIMGCSLVLAVFVIAGMWKVFTKAGEPGWACIIPIYNLIVLLKIAGRPAWWFLLMLIPFVNFIILIIVSIDVAKNFGQGTGFGIGLAFLGFIFYPILGFGSARYMPAQQMQYGGGYPGGGYPPAPGGGYR